ncbi:hypothetical protein GCM10011309_15760 [Litorimonas cladophorae]|uniref:Uncharacterized protein n=1 Tax=Litorimonas cladophorae TaxID=1220491 RepID=A0A918KL17_9PROT|nr:hypothetical protein [Litorimonas cladophorae]GGX66982.1 hypothetical protein GCM10011309_15760 [Litorimonas cladophorae]
MEKPWCENIQVVHDTAVLWPSAITLSFILAALGVFFTYQSLQDGDATIQWLYGPILLLFAILHFDGVNTDRADMQALSRDDGKVVMIGNVSRQQIEFGSIGSNANSRQLDVKPWTFWHFPPHHREAIWFHVGKVRIKTNAGLLTVKGGNRCNGFRCGMTVGDRIRVSTHQSLYVKPRLKPGQTGYFEPYYSEAMKIERCDD